MTPKEAGALIRSLREGKEVFCPECKKGRIVTPYEAKTSMYFKCTNCNFKINMEPIEKR